eukprot:scaffold51300_cov46-Phaeocystis_antarctica.AAC.2
MPGGLHPGGLGTPPPSQLPTSVATPGPRVNEPPSARLDHSCARELRVVGLNTALVARERQPVEQGSGPFTICRRRALDAAGALALRTRQAGDHPAGFPCVKVRAPASPAPR